MSSQDQHLSLEDIAARLKQPADRLRYFYDHRSDCPQPVAHVKNKLNWTQKPLFSLNEFTAFLQDLGLIARDPDPSKITLLESATLLGISYNRIKDLKLRDPRFPKVLRGKIFWNSHKHLLFERADMLAYKLQRRTRKGPQEKPNVNPINASGDIKADVKKFLASPSELRPRLTTTGTGKTVRVRTEGVVGTW
jgi:hypothetical protein